MVLLVVGITLVSMNWLGRSGTTKPCPRQSVAQVIARRSAMMIAGSGLRLMNLSSCRSPPVVQGSIRRASTTSAHRVVVGPTVGLSERAGQGNHARHDLPGLLAGVRARRNRV